MTNMPVCLLLLVPSQYELNVHNLQSCLCFIAMAPLSNRLWALWKDEKKHPPPEEELLCLVEGSDCTVYIHKDIPFCLIWLYSDVWTWTVIRQPGKCEIRCKVLEFDAAGQKQLKELQLQSVWSLKKEFLKVSHFLSGYTQILILPPRLTGQNTISAWISTSDVTIWMVALVVGGMNDFRFRRRQTLMLREKW